MDGESCLKARSQIERNWITPGYALYMFYSWNKSLGYLNTLACITYMIPRLKNAQAIVSLYLHEIHTLYPPPTWSTIGVFVFMNFF